MLEHQLTREESFLKPIPIAGKTDYSGAYEVRSDFETSPDPTICCVRCNIFPLVKVSCIPFSFHFPLLGEAVPSMNLRCYWCE